MSTVTSVRLQMSEHLYVILYSSAARSTRTRLWAGYCHRTGGCSHSESHHGPSSAKSSRTQFQRTHRCRQILHEYADCQASLRQRNEIKVCTKIVANLDVCLRPQDSCLSGIHSCSFTARDGLSRAQLGLQNVTYQSICCFTASPLKCLA